MALLDDHALLAIHGPDPLPPYRRHRRSARSPGSCTVVPVEAPIDPVNAEYRIAFEAVGGRLRSRHGICQGFDRLTAFLRPAHIPTPEIERAWRTLVERRVHSIPRGGLPPAHIETLWALGTRSARSMHVQLFQVRAVPRLGDPITAPR